MFKMSSSCLRTYRVYKQDSGVKNKIIDDGKKINRTLAEAVECEIEISLEDINKLPSCGFMENSTNHSTQQDLTQINTDRSTSLLNSDQDTTLSYDESMSEEENVDGVHEVDVMEDQESVEVDQETSDRHVIEFKKEKEMVENDVLYSEGLEKIKYSIKVSKLEPTVEGKDGMPKQISENNETLCSVIEEDILFADLSNEKELMKSTILEDVFDLYKDGKMNSRSVNSHSNDSLPEFGEDSSSYSGEDKKYSIESKRKCEESVFENLKIDPSSFNALKFHGVNYRFPDQVNDGSIALDYTCLNGDDSKDTVVHLEQLNCDIDTINDMINRNSKERAKSEVDPAKQVSKNDSTVNEIEMNDIVRFNNYIYNLNNAKYLDSRLMDSRIMDDFEDETTNTTTSNSADSPYIGYLSHHNLKHVSQEDLENPDDNTSNSECNEVGDDFEVLADEIPENPEQIQSQEVVLPGIEDLEFPKEDVELPDNEDFYDEPCKSGSKVFDAVQEQSELQSGERGLLVNDKALRDLEKAAGSSRLGGNKRVVNTNLFKRKGNNNKLNKDISHGRRKVNEFNLKNGYQFLTPSTTTTPVANPLRNQTSSNPREEDDFTNMCTPKNKKIPNVNLKGIEMIRSNSDKLIKTINYTLNNNNKRKVNNSSFTATTSASATTGRNKRKRFILINPNYNNEHTSTTSVASNGVNNTNKVGMSNRSSGIVNGLNDKLIEKNCISEMWNDNINVIVYKKMKLGYGSFSTVSLALLRFINNSSKSMSSTLTGDQTSGDKDEKNEKVGNVIYECAIKNINNNYGELSRYQYIREKEMMLHYNQNVLKPISYRILYNYDNIYNNDSKLYQILLPRAKGDLLSMLVKLVIYRTSIVYNIENDLSTQNSKSPAKKGGSSSSDEKSDDRKYKFYGLFLTEVKYILIQILTSMIYIHNCFQGNILRHTDIKLNNILVFCNEEDKYNPLKWQLNLSDFGSSILTTPNNYIENITSASNSDNDMKKMHVVSNDAADKSRGLGKNVIYDYYMNEYNDQIHSQLLSYNIGTLKYNSPETLSYDEYLNKRVNNNRLLLNLFYRNIMPQNTGDVASSGDNLGDTFYESGLVGDVMKSDVVLNNVKYVKVDDKSDVWSFGIIIIELIKYIIHYDDFDTSNLLNSNMFSYFLMKRYGINVDGSGVVGDCDGKKLRDGSQYCYINKNLRIKHVLYNNIGNGLFHISNKRNKVDKKNRQPIHPVGAVVADKERIDDENKLLSIYINNICNNKFDVRRSKLLNIIQKYVFQHSPSVNTGDYNLMYNDRFNLLINLLTNILSYYPSERLNSIEILGHDFFTNSKSLFELIDHNNQVFINRYKYLYTGNNPNSTNCSTKDGVPSLDKDQVYDDKYSFSWYKGPFYYHTYPTKGEEFEQVGKRSKMKIYKLEHNILKTRLRDLYNDQDIVYKILKRIQKQYKLNYHQLTSTFTSHLLSRRLYLTRQHLYNLK